MRKKMDITIPCLSFPLSCLSFTLSCLSFPFGGASKNTVLGI